jgi:alpha-ketoglutarate-dependent taurine dioxygenase
LHINIITTDKAANPAEDLWKNRPADIRNAWHTDAGYETNPPDYSILKLTKLPKSGGGKSNLLLLHPQSSVLIREKTQSGRLRARSTTKSPQPTADSSKPSRRHFPSPVSLRLRAKRALNCTPRHAARLTTLARP